MKNLNEYVGLSEGFMNHRFSWFSLASSTPITRHLVSDNTEKNKLSTKLH